MANEIVEAAETVMAEAKKLVKRVFPNDSDDMVSSGLKRGFNEINRSPRAILNAHALLQAYAAFRK